MKNTSYRLEQYSKAIKRLNEIIVEYRRTDNDFLIDGLIQRFEFCTELSWKLLKDYMMTDLASPRAIFKEAYSRKLILDENGWLMLITDRNLTSHTYDEETANTIKDNIINYHINILSDLNSKMKELIDND